MQISVTSSKDFQVPHILLISEHVAKHFIKNKYKRLNFNHHPGFAKRYRKYFPPKLENEYNAWQVLYECLLV